MTNFPCSNCYVQRSALADVASDNPLRTEGNMRRLLNEVKKKKSREKRHSMWPNEVCLFFNLKMLYCEVILFNYMSCRVLYGALNMRTLTLEMCILH